MDSERPGPSRNTMETDRSSAKCKETDSHTDTEDLETKENKGTPPKEMKSEPEEASTSTDRPKVDHASHGFRVQINNSSRTFTVCCTQAQSALDAIKTLSAYKANIKCSDDQVILQLGVADKRTAIPTHFPCSLIKEDELIVVSAAKMKTEKQGNERQVFPKEQCIIFYIETRAGENAITVARTNQGLFLSSAIKRFTRLCVYASKGMTVKQALESDGRFVDLNYFTLFYTNSADRHVECTQTVGKLNRKTFRISLPKREGNTGHRTRAGNTEMTGVSRTESRITCPEVAPPESRAVSVKVKIEKMKENGENTGEVYEILQKQFPELRILMESRFPGDTLDVALKKVDFGKVHKSFRRVHLIKKLSSLGDSVCKIYVGNRWTGTGFVLFDNYILTNAHLFKEDRINDRITVPVIAQFDYETAIENNSYMFEAEETVIDVDWDLDYAVLKLKPGVGEVPPGLMKDFGPKPQNGEACIIGHPKGDVKNMDLICIIEEEKRIEVANKKLEPFNRDTIMTIVQNVKDQGITRIMTSDEVVTYDTFMYHGSSGSPLFDSECRVVGLHSGGFVYEHPEGRKESVIEYARPVLEIFRSFVTNLKNKENESILKTAQDNSRDNSHLKPILESVVPRVDVPDSMDTP